MKILFAPIVLLFVHNSHGHQYEGSISSNESLTDSTLNDEQTENAYHTVSLSKWLNETDGLNDITLNHDLFQKMIKLTAAYLRRGYNKESILPLDGDNAEVSEILDDDTVYNMLQYYEKMAVERNHSKYTNITDTLTEEVKHNFAHFWQKNLQQFKQWWNKTRILDFQVSNKLQSVKKIGEKFKSFLFRAHPIANTTPEPNDEFTFRNRRLLYITRTTLRTYSFLERDYVRRVRKYFKEAERWLRFVNAWRKKRAKKDALARGETWPTPPTLRMTTKEPPMVVRLQKYLHQYLVRA